VDSRQAELSKCNDSLRRSEVRHGKDFVLEKVGQRNDSDVKLLGKVPWFGLTQVQVSGTKFEQVPF
jgi:hypothetical protein